jgi:gluconolactonase
MNLVRYPDPSIEVLDPRFGAIRIGNAAVERLWTGARWTEGPVWFGDGGYLLFSDIPNDRILRWDAATGQVTPYRSASNFSNGNTRDLHGRLITCEHGPRRVTRTEYAVAIPVLPDNYQGKRLNAPNDVVVTSDGAIWFTDPGYGLLFDYEGGKAPFELPTAVYRIDPGSGLAAMVLDDFDRPNGLCFSPDVRRLYVVDSGKPCHIRVFDVDDGWRLVDAGVFADMSPGTSDGIRGDSDGNLWASAAWGGDGYDGVHCFAPDGTRIGRILLPEACSNVCFGGLRKNRLFMTGSQSLYAVYLNARGVQWP